MRIETPGRASTNSAGAASVISCAKAALQRAFLTGTKRRARGRSRACPARSPPSPEANSSYRSSTSSRGFTVTGSGSIAVRLLPWGDGDVEALLDHDGAPLQHLHGADPVERNPDPAANALVELLPERGCVAGLVLDLLDAEVVESERSLELVEAVLVLEQSPVEGADLGVRIDFGLE